MPIYEYICPSCEYRFEILRPLSKATEAASCPRCQNDAERKLSTFACFSTNDMGLSAPVGGSACSSCSTGSCSTCGV